MEGYSTSLVIRKMQIKITVRFHFLPTRIAIAKTQKTTSAGGNVEKLEPTHAAAENVKWLSHHGKRLAVPQ